MNTTKFLSSLLQMYFKIKYSTYIMNVGTGAPRGRSDLPLIEARIVGGQVVEPNSLPFQISLQRRNFAGFAHSCGGSVYNENYIVDAAHCGDGSVNNYNNK